MNNGVARVEIPADTLGDLNFECSHCHIPLVVDGAAAGMTLNCQRCGNPTAVPQPAPRRLLHAAEGSAQERLAELARHLKENESQRTEVKGYINQLSIQLHRWQLRLQTLEQRNQDLTREMAGLQEGDGPVPLG